MEIFSVSCKTIYNWLNRWESEGMVGLYNKHGRGCKPKFNSSVNTSTSANLISNTSIWHNGILKVYSPEFNTIQVGSSQVSTIEANAIKNSITEVSSSQVSFPEYSIFEPSSAQTSTSKIGTDKTTHAQVSTTEIGTTKIGIVKTTLPQLSTIKVGSTQIALSKVISAILAPLKSALLKSVSIK